MSEDYSNIPLDELVRDYAEWFIVECTDGEDVAGSLMQVAREADSFTAPHIAALLLIANEGLADPPYKYGGVYFDPQLAEMARRIGWHA